MATSISLSKAISARSSTPSHHHPSTPPTTHHLPSSISISSSSSLLKTSSFSLKTSRHALSAAVRASVVESFDKSTSNETTTTLIDKSVNTIRFLAIDAVEKANSGHPGLPMGCAPMGHILYDEIMRYNPKNPYWFNRDRFVLSAGHGCMLQYALLHLAGYDSVTSWVSEPVPIKITSGLFPSELSEMTNETNQKLIQLRC